MGFVYPCPAKCNLTGGCDACRQWSMSGTAVPQVVELPALPCSHGTQHGTFCELCYQASRAALTFCPHGRQLPAMCPHCANLASYPAT